jgi:hypothetical protein
VATAGNDVGEAIRGGEHSMNDLTLPQFLIGLMLVGFGFAAMCLLSRVIEWWGERRGKS